MRQEIALNEFINPEVKETKEIIQDYRELEFMKKEVDMRIKCVKGELMKRVKGTNNVYSDDLYSLELKSIESKRLDTKAIKVLFEQVGEDISKYQTISKSERLNIKRVDF